MPTGRLFTENKTDSLRNSSCNGSLGFFVFFDFVPLVIYFQLSLVQFFGKFTFMYTQMFLDLVFAIHFMYELAKVKCLVVKLATEFRLLRFNHHYKRSCYNIQISKVMFRTGNS